MATEHKFDIDVKDWDGMTHLKDKNGIERHCESCHGDIGHSEHAKVYQQNRISKYSRDIWGYSISRFSKPGEHEGMTMKMNDCAKCHLQETGSKGACFQCHK